MKHERGRMPWFRFWGVRTRLTLWYTLITALLLLTFSVLLYYAVARIALVNLDTNLRSDAQRIAIWYVQHHSLPPENVGENPLSKKEMVVVLDIHQSVRESQGLPSPAVLEQVLHHVPAPGNIGACWLNDKNATSATEYRLFTQAVLEQQQHIATLVVGMPRTDYLLLRDLTLGLLLSGPVLLLLTTMGGYWFASRALRSVQIMTRAASGMSETDLNQRFPIHYQDELGELAMTFNQMLSRLEMAFQRQRQFTADASHELRTPLSIINMALHRGLSQCHTYAEVLPILQTVQAESDHMTRLVNDLLFLARTDAAYVSFKRARLDVSDLVFDVVTRLLPQAEQYGVTLIVDEMPELWVVGDEAQLTLLISNLVENALKYTAHYGHLVLIKGGCEIHDHKHYVSIHISDDGLGIAPNHLPHIFDRFYRVDIARSSADQSEKDDREMLYRGGNGLGLSIALHVAQTHEGVIHVQSQEGQGSSFEVWLPLSQKKDFEVSLEE